LPVKKIEEIEDFDIEQMREYAKELEDKAFSESTWINYKCDWKQFKKWCAKVEVDHLPASIDTIQNFLSWMVKERKYKWKTIERYICSITKFHDLAEEIAPTRHPKVKKQVAGIRRTIKTKSTPKNHLTLVDLISICHKAPDTNIWLRDKAILTLGFAGAMRRIEIAALNVEDVIFMNDGAIINIWGAKGARRGEVQRVGVPMGQNEIICPVRNLKNWLAFTKLTEGPLFLPMTPNGKRVWDIRHIHKAVPCYAVKKGVAMLGYNPDLYGGHSLRHGLATAASNANIPLARIRQHTRHNSVQSLLPYIADSELFSDNPASLIGI